MTKTIKLSNASASRLTRKRQDRLIPPTKRVTRVRRDERDFWNPASPNQAHQSNSSSISSSSSPERFNFESEIVHGSKFTKRRNQSCASIGSYEEDTNNYQFDDDIDFNENFDDDDDDRDILDPFSENAHNNEDSSCMEYAKLQAMVGGEIITDDWGNYIHQSDILDEKEYLGVKPTEYIGSEERDETSSVHSISSVVTVIGNPQKSATDVASPNFTQSPETESDGSVLKSEQLRNRHKYSLLRHSTRAYHDRSVGSSVTKAKGIQKVLVRRMAGDIETALSTSNIASRNEMEKLRQSHIDSVRKTLALACFPVFHVPSMDFFARGDIIPIQKQKQLNCQLQSSQPNLPQLDSEISSKWSTAVASNASKFPNVCFWDHHALFTEQVESLSGDLDPVQTTGNQTSMHRAGDMRRPEVLRQGRKAIPISRIKKPFSNEVSYTFFGCFCSWECAHSFQSLYFSGKYTENLLLARKELDGVPILTPMRQHPHPFILKRYGGDYTIERYRHWWTESIGTDSMVQTVVNGDVSYMLNTGTQIFGVTDVCARRRRGGSAWQGSNYDNELFEFDTTTDDRILSEYDKLLLSNFASYQSDGIWGLAQLHVRRQTAIESCLLDTDTATTLHPLQCGKRLRKHVILKVSLFDVPYYESSKYLVWSGMRQGGSGVEDFVMSPDSCVADENGSQIANALSSPSSQLKRQQPQLNPSNSLGPNNHNATCGNMSTSTGNILRKPTSRQTIPAPAPTLVIRINDETSRKATIHQNQMDELIHLDYARRVKKRENTILNNVSATTSMSSSSSPPLFTSSSPQSLQSPQSPQSSHSQNIPQIPQSPQSTSTIVSNASHGFQRVHDAPKYVRKAIDASVKKKTEIHSMLYNASPHSTATRGNHRTNTMVIPTSAAATCNLLTGNSGSHNFKRRSGKSVEEAALEEFEKNDEAKELLDTVLNAAVLHTNKANDYLDCSVRGSDTCGGEVSFDAATGVLTVSGRSSHVSRSSNLALLVNAGGDGTAAIKAAMAYANADAYFDVGISHKRKRKRRDASLCESLEQLAENLSSTMTTP